MGRIRSWLSLARLIDTLLAAVIAVVCLTATITTILPMTGHPVTIITGGSMSPAIPIGSLVVEEPSPIANLAPGDIATFRLASGVKVTHRVTRVVERADGTWYEIKGDANEAPDPALLSSGSVVGRVIVSAPLLGYLTWLLHQPRGILAVVTGILALFIAGLLAGESEEVEPAQDPVQDPVQDPTERPVPLVA
jgi:signal peptidase